MRYYGSVSEWLKEAASKTVDRVKAVRRFESCRFRKHSQKVSVPADTFCIFAKITEATCRQANDFRTDGSGAAQLSFPIVGLHIDFPAVNHLEVASDTNCLARLFLTDYCKALSRADFNKDDFHLTMNDSGLRARSGFNSTPSVLVKKNRASISDENKYPAYIQHRELAFSQPLNHLC